MSDAEVESYFDIVSVISLMALNGCNLKWLHSNLKLDIPDYYYSQTFVDYSNLSKTKRHRGYLDEFISQHQKLFGNHPIIFDPNICKGMESKLNGSIDGGGNILWGGISGSVSGKSSTGVSYYFCWKLNNGSKKAYITVLPSEKVVLNITDGDSEVRFKFDLS